MRLLAIAAFVLFGAALRRLLTEAERDDLLATTAFGGALLGIAAGLGAETINTLVALGARDGELSDALAQSLWEIARVLGSTAAGVGLGTSALATAAVALRTGRILPRWLAIATDVVGTWLLTLSRAWPGWRLDRRVARCGHRHPAWFSRRPCLLRAPGPCPREVIAVQRRRSSRCRQAEL